MTELSSTPQRKVPSPERAWDVRDPGFRADPYPRYAALRERPDLTRTVDGLWVLTRHADVLAVLRDPRLSSHPKHIPAERLAARGRQAIPFVGEGVVEIMLMADAPDHTRLRRLAAKAFTPRAVERLRGRVGELVDGLLDAADERGSLDLMADLAEPLPVLVICDLLGVPVEDQEQFKPWSSAIARMLDADAASNLLQDAVPAVMGFVQYFAALIEERRASPREDLLSGLIAAEADGDKLNQAELFAMVILLFIAGHETTTNLLGNGTLALARNPDQWRALREDPGLVVPGTDELLRYDSPVQLTARTATCDLEVRGIELRTGEAVLCSLAGANRDPRFVEDPERLDLRRGTPHHVSFGNGMHLCLGAPLARMEGQIVFQRLAARYATLEAPAQPPYRDHFVLRGLASLPLETTPAA